jgi:uncharacterized membrane protein
VIGGLELHPAVVHFPIALSVVGALAVLAYAALRRDWLRWFGPILLTLALLGGVAAYFSGQAAKDRAEAIGVPVAEIARHEETGLWALGLLALATLLAWATHARHRGVWLSSLIALAAAGVIVWNSHLGARLVYIHGAGRVQSAAGDERLEGTPRSFSSPLSSRIHRFRLATRERIDVFLIVGAK